MKKIETKFFRPCWVRKILLKLMRGGFFKNVKFGVGAMKKVHYIVTVGELLCEFLINYYPLVIYHCLEVLTQKIGIRSTKAKSRKIGRFVIYFLNTKLLTCRWVIIQHILTGVTTARQWTGCRSTENVFWSALNERLYVKNRTAGPVLQTPRSSTLPSGGFLSI